MHEFFWNITVAYLLLFLVLSSVLYVYSRQTSFKYYAVYNVGVFLYLLTKGERLYYGLKDNSLFNIFDAETVGALRIHFNWMIQVFFYSVYFLFALYFLDFQKFSPRIIPRLKKVFLVVNIIFFSLCIVSIFFDFYLVVFYTFAFGFIPFILFLSIYYFRPAMRFSGDQKYFFLAGVFFYIIFALLAFYSSYFSKTNAPLVFFFIGIIIENICFSLGLAFKFKMINDEKNFQQNKAINAEHAIELTKLRSVIEGEENERKRIAEDLHDGIIGDLSAIKLHVAILDEKGTMRPEKKNLQKIIDMIDQACTQVRRISHDLMPASIEDFGLIESVNQYCKKLNLAHITQIDFQTFGVYNPLSKNHESTLYRIIQELLNNIIKHAYAEQTLVQINFHEDEISISVEDDGKGFESESIHEGIGLKNVRSRVKLLQGELDVKSSEKGTFVHILIDLNKLNHD
ncbi:sensor histidine kinase [Moheibacter sediminis]|uniref:histidine kinase n=1 Tax=Moheibacter sediminis TaxID=1434700 RepID=A0A1W1YL95_9FLAO|nr:sensor histidine kinase [Moheibacter sediminis]SMC36909.1 Signal transduction histidine kinase [Moheibacter sediminis]